MRLTPESLTRLAMAVTAAAHGRACGRLRAFHPVNNIEKLASRSME
jgi:hypothetical protein